jgi:hypothetical protein
MQLVVPSAVSIAEIIDAMICSVHLRVSFLVISHRHRSRHLSDEEFWEEDRLYADLLED